MASEDLLPTASPSSASSTDSELLAFGQTGKKIVTVPYKMLLDAILQELRLPSADYHLEMREDNNVRMRILLKPSELQPQGFHTDMWIFGIWTTGYKEAEDSASIESISFLEKINNMVVKDVNYHRLKQLEEQNEDLMHQLKEAKVCKEKFARGWFLSVRNMHSFSQQIQSIVVMNYSLEDNPVDEIWNTLLCNIAGLGFRLKTIGLKLERRLEKMMNHS